MKHLFSAGDKFFGKLYMKIYGRSSASSNDRLAPIKPFL